MFLELPDQLGSTSIVVDKDTSELVEAASYQAYGAPESDYRPDRWRGNRADYRFTGKEDDIEVGLSYFGERYLSTALNRWASADPLTIHAIGADLNVYAYVSGKALQAVDPLGLEDTIPEGAQDVQMHDNGQASYVPPAGYDPGADFEIADLNSTPATPQAAPTSSPTTPVSGSTQTAAPQATPPASFAPPAPSAPALSAPATGPTVGQMFDVGTTLLSLTWQQSSVGRRVNHAINYWQAHPDEAVDTLNKDLAVAQLVVNIAMEAEGGPPLLPPGSSPALAGGSTGSVPVATPATVPALVPPIFLQSGNDKKADAPKPMFGARGTQVTSKTIWKGPGGARIDVENPNPGQRAGQIHFQQGAAKYLYNPETKTFANAPPSLNSLLESEGVQDAIAKGLRYLGE
ncbi:MAG: RHS repeat-associated core domain-containing protein [Polyangiaceae bacterium]